MDEKERVSVLELCVCFFLGPESFYMCCLSVRNMFALPM